MSAGYKFEYVTVQLALSVCLIVLALTARLETFFLLCGVAGVQRAVSHLVPFAVVSDAVRAEVKRIVNSGIDQAVEAELKAHCNETYSAVCCGSVYRANKSSVAVTHTPVATRLTTPLSLKRKSPRFLSVQNDHRND